MLIMPDVNLALAVAADGFVTIVLFALFGAVVTVSLVLLYLIGTSK
jgi:hypothetical protein